MKLEIISSLLRSTQNTRYIINENFGRNIIRSDTLDRINEQDIITLKQLLVNKIINLRHTTNKKLKEISEYNNIIFIDIPLVSTNIIENRFKMNKENIISSYMGFINEELSVYKILNEILYSSGTVLYYCKYGVDRTGVISFLLELSCGIPINYIINDYLCNNLKDDRYKKLIDMTLEDRDKAFRLFVERFFYTYGTAEDYLRNLGFAKNEIRMLKRKICPYV